VIFNKVNSNLWTAGVNSGCPFCAYWELSLSGGVWTIKDFGKEELLGTMANVDGCPAGTYSFSGCVWSCGYSSGKVGILT